MLISRLERAQERGLLLECLEGSVSELGRCINKLELNLLQVSSARMHLKRLANRDHAFLRSRYRSLQDQEVVLHDTVMRESTHRCNSLLRDV